MPYQLDTICLAKAAILFFLSNREGVVQGKIVVSRPLCVIPNLFETIQSRWTVFRVCQDIHCITLHDITSSRESKHTSNARFPPPIACGRGGGGGGVSIPNRIS